MEEYTNWCETESSDYTYAIKTATGKIADLEAGPGKKIKQHEKQQNAEKLTRHSAIDRAGISPRPLHQNPVRAIWRNSASPMILWARAFGCGSDGWTHAVRGLS